MSEKPAYRFNGRLPAALAPLRERAQWICWTYIETKPGKWTKPPLSAHTGRPASGGAQHPDNWGTFEQALATQRRHNLAGVGYVLTRDDNITGIDLDDCITDSGSYNEIAAEVLSYGETYGELSPSKKGIRLFVLGKYAGGLIKNDGVGVEVYTELRYLTVTGLHHEDTPAEIAPAPRTLAFLAKLGLTKPKQETPALPPPRPAGDFFGSVNSAALAALDRWVPELHPSAKKQATGAWRITSYGLNRDLEEDLSYHPTGIRDHGEEVGLTPIDAVLKHGTATNAIEAAHWLCHRMGMEPGALGWQGAPRAVSLIIRDPGQVKTAEPEQPQCLIETDDEITDFTVSTGIIKGVVGLGQLGAIWGASTAGKTFVALDAAFAIARAQDWFGRHVREPWPVLYVNLEGAAGFRNRIFAITKEAGTTGGMFARIVVSPMLNKSAGGDEGMATIIKAASQLSERNNGKPVGMIVIDTLARAMAGDDENTAQDMAAFINRCATIAAATGAAIMIVHHGGKDDARGMRGSSALFAACDAVLKVEAMGDVRTITAEKIKDGETGQIGAFTLRRVVLGYDEDNHNEEVTSCVVDPTEAPLRRSPGPSRGKSEKQNLTLRAVEAAIEEHGRQSAGTSTIPAGVTTVTFDQVFIYASKNGALNPDRPARKQRSDLRERLKALAENVQIGQWGELIWKINT